MRDQQQVQTGTIISKIPVEKSFSLRHALSLIYTKLSVSLKSKLPISNRISRPFYAQIKYGLKTSQADGLQEELRPA